MEKSNIALVMGAILCTSLLIGFDVQKAYAISHVDLTASMTLSASNPAMDNCGLFICALGEYTGTVTPIYRIDADTQSIVLTTNLSGRHDGLACNSSICMTSLSSGITISKISVSTLTITATGNASNTISDPTSLDLSGSIFVYAKITSGATRTIELFNTDSMTVSAIYPTTIGAFAVKDLVYEASINRIALMNDQPIFEIWNTESASRVCTVNAGVTTNSGDIKYDSTGNRWLTVADSSNALKIISPACSITNTVTGFGESNYNIGVELDVSRDEIYIATSSATTTKLVVLDYTSLVKNYEYASIGTSFRDYMVYDSVNKVVAIASSSGDLIRLIALDAFGGEGIVGGIDCSIPANANILTCRLATIGNTPLAGASQTIGESSTDISCQIGFIACTNGVPNNPDIRTNGIGYVIVAVALGVFVGLLWVASRGDLMSIPNFVWMVGTIAIIGVITAIEYVDPTFLIISIIVVIALAAMKVRNMFGSSELFKGEG